MHNKSITIIGPTASGKSALAIALAKQFNGEIISADSRQIYRGMDIGSGKEQGRLTHSTKRGPATQCAYISGGVPHYMIDILHPNTRYSAAAFVKKAQKIRADIWQRDKIPIIAGGTMFWAQALCENTTFANVPPNPVLRRKLEARSTKQLLSRLSTKDPRRARDIIVKNEINNRPRIIRALEIAATLGTVPHNTKTPHDLQKDLILAVTHPQNLLHGRIEKRMDQWFDDGIFEEILALHNDLRVPWIRLESFGLEYKWCSRYVRGHITYDAMRTNILKDIKKYAKRQMTWIRRWKKSGAHITRITTIREAKKLTRTFLQK